MTLRCLELSSLTPFPQLHHPFPPIPLSPVPLQLSNAVASRAANPAASAPPVTHVSSATVMPGTKRDMTLPTLTPWAKG